jgi:ABC-type lipoprotein release transport system permease subunit
MTFRGLLWRNLFYHWRGNLAVMLGVVVGTAVLTGALLVGDSLRGSLREQALERLGWVHYALLPGRFFREELAGELGAERACPAVILQGPLTRGSGDDARRAPRAVLLGVDERFWPEGRMPLQHDFWRPASPGDLANRRVVLGAALAHDLGASVGDRVTFSLQKATSAPRESFLGKRKGEDVLTELPLTVAAILPDDDFGSRFRLSPSTDVPRNAFVPLSALQFELRYKERSLPAQPINAVLLRRGQPNDLQGALWHGLQLADMGLVLRAAGKRGAGRERYYSLESREMFLQRPVLVGLQWTGLTVAPTLVYLVNTIATAERLSAEIPYAIVAALDPGQPVPWDAAASTDPLVQAMRNLQDDQILLVQYPGSPLADAKPGDRLKLTFFQPGEEGALREETATFRLAATLPLKGADDDPNLTPTFPGITDRPSIREGWEPPFPFDRSRIKDADEDFWRAHRTTPRAYVTLKAGQRLWGGRFGEFTSLRIAAKGLSKEQVADRILGNLHPEAFGFEVRDVRGRSLQASAGASDFGLLFLGFSVFLIAAALLLVGLLFRVNLDRRASEVGLLLAAGFRRRSVRWLLLAEGGLLALVGGVLGCAVALLYAWLMLAFLRASWPGGLDRSFLHLHVHPHSFIHGYVASVAVSLLTIVWATRLLSRVAPSALLAGATISTQPETDERRRPRWSLWVAAVAGLGAIASLIAGAFASDHEAQAGSFFSGGALLLTALLSLVWARLRGRPTAATAPTLTRLGVRNAGRHPLRSVLTVGLLASATFLVVAVQAFHRDPGADFLAKDGGSGGFPLLAEAEVPIYQDLNSARGQEELELSDATRDVLRQARIYPLRLSPGDDASCLNLYRPLQPRLLGVPPTLIERGGFSFAATEASTEEERANPWLLLRQQREDGAIPVFGEANSVKWVLNSNLGQELTVKDGRGGTARLRIVGLLEDSVFQSELLTSDRHFLEAYPRQEGFRMFLIDAPAERQEQVMSALEAGLAKYGMSVTPSAQRLASYLAVENTYLATFQALGGLGLLLGALGLAVVLVRGVWERRGELALLRAVGFRRGALGWLVLAENACLLAVGLAVGTAAALLSVAPHLVGGAGAVPWVRLIGLLGLVLAVGLAAGTAAVAASVRTPVLTALRRE